MNRWINFVDKVQQAQNETATNIALFFNPQLNLLPIAATRFDDPFLPFGKAIINASKDSVCAYIFDLASYLSIGAAGAVALERTIRYVPNDRVTILHGAFSSDGFSAMADTTGFGVDAITITDRVYLRTYLDKPPYAAFVTHHGAIDPINLPDEGGIFWIDAGQMTLNPQTTIKLTDNAVLYAGQFDDYAQKTREALAALR
jgi:hypothetical protein